MIENSNCKYWTFVIQIKLTTDLISKSLVHLTCLSLSWFNVDLHLVICIPIWPLSRHMFRALIWIEKSLLASQEIKRLGIKINVIQHWLMRGVFIKILLKLIIWLFLIEGSDIYQLFLVPWKKFELHSQNYRFCVSKWFWKSSTSFLKIFWGPRFSKSSKQFLKAYLEIRL